MNGLIALYVYLALLLALFVLYFVRTIDKEFFPKFPYLTRRRRPLPGGSQTSQPPSEQWQIGGEPFVPPPGPAAPEPDFWSVEKCNDRGFTDGTSCYTSNSDSPYSSGGD